MKNNLSDKSKIITHTQKRLRWNLFLNKFYIFVIVIYISLLFRDYSREFYGSLQV